MRLAYRFFRFAIGRILEDFKDPLSFRHHPPECRFFFEKDSGLYAADTTYIPLNCGTVNFGDSENCVTAKNDMGRNPLRSIKTYCCRINNGGRQWGQTFILHLVK
jgi:hypothetical protein